MKLLISTDLAPPYIGGGESYVINLGSKLVNLGNEVHWLTSKISGTKSYENYHGIHIHRVPILFPNNFLFPGRQTFFLTSIITAIKLARKMDVIQTNTLVPGASGWFVAKYAGKPSLLFCHELFLDLWKKVGQNIFEKNFYPFMEKIIASSPYDWYACPSKYSKKTLIKAGAPKEKISVIPHGIDFNLFNTKVSGVKLRKKFNLQNKKLIGYTGRLKISGTGQSKNLVMLLESLKLVIKEIPDAMLVFGGSNFDEIYKAVKKLNLEKFVFYTGERPYKEVPQFYAMCDVIVCPAVSDGFCFMLAEASACGKPVVATKAGSHPERIINNKTGILTSVSPQSLAEGIIKILENPKLAKRFGQNGAKLAKKFTWEESVKKHLEIYEMLVKKT